MCMVLSTYWVLVPHHLRIRSAFWSQLHICQVSCLHLQRLQRANDILLIRRNKHTDRQTDRHVKNNKGKKTCFITMCKAHSKVTHIKQRKYFHHLKRPGYNIEFFLYPRPFRWWKYFCCSMCHFAMALTHCYKTSFLHLYLQFFY